jgi:recombination protein RecT
MTKAEVEAIRKCSKAGNSGAWKDFYNEMAKKTAFKRLSKWLPLSPEVRDAIAKDDEVEFAPQVEVVPPAPKLFADVSPEIEVEVKEESDVID